MWGFLYYVIVMFINLKYAPMVTDIKSIWSYTGYIIIITIIFVVAWKMTLFKSPLTESFQYKYSIVASAFSPKHLYNKNGRNWQSTCNVPFTSAVVGSAPSIGILACSIYLHPRISSYLRTPCGGSFRWKRCAALTICSMTLHRRKVGCPLSWSFLGLPLDFVVVDDVPGTVVLIIVQSSCSRKII